MMKKQNNGINFVRWRCRVCNQHLKVWRSKIIQSLMDEELEQPVLSFLNGEEGWDTNYSSISEFKRHLEQPVLSILRGRQGWNDECSSISEFKHNLKEDTLADHERFKYGWVFWRENNTTHLQHKITTLFKHLRCRFLFSYMVQFWGVMKVEGRRHYLSTSHHPFSVSDLQKGYSWYRKQCMDHVYCVEVDGAVEEAQLGGVGRAYRDKHPESTPDLRLYSTNEFPLRDHAARCGFRNYLALPLFDLHTNECCGVLELLSHCAGIDGFLISSLTEQLQIAGLRSTHINFNPISRSEYIMPDKYKQQVDTEIKELLETVIQALPRLSLAQVWVRCIHCDDTKCMERAYFIAAPSKKVNSCNYKVDGDMFDYLQACEFHHLQLDRNHFHQNLKDRSISKSPLEHYAHWARLSHCFAICMQSVDNSNDPFVIEFFLQPECSSLHLLSRIIQMKLKSFKCVGGEQQLLEIFQSSQPNEIECESIDMLKVMNSYQEEFSESNFKKYMDTVDDTCCQRPTSALSWKGWVFSCPSRERLCEDHANSNTLFVPVLMKERIEEFMKKMTIRYGTSYWIVQFWAPKMAEGRCYLETSTQPYALRCLAKGLASFRKECMKHHYFVDDEAKEEELGPPGRVFRNKHTEITPDLLLYSTKEFPMKNYAMHCCLQEYLVLPVFDGRKRKCAGVLEFIGFGYCELEVIGRALKVLKLQSTDHIHFRPKFIADKTATTINCRKMVLQEVNNAFSLIGKIPHLHMAKMWVPYEKCDFISSNASCMELALSTNNIGYEYMPTDEVHWIHVQPRKGIIGVALESESKSCFCRDLREFNIIDQPLALNDRSERLDVCFAICLQSSHTGDLTYVLELFLKPSPEYVEPFFKFLLAIMKQKLKSFKYACGKQLGEELVVDVIQFSEASNPAFSELGQLDDVPIKFRSVQYGQMEHQQAEEPVQYVSDGMQTEQCRVAAASVSKKTEKGKRKTGFPLSLEDLEPHFGKKLKDVAKELGVGRSTIKRACRYHNIGRWPCNEKQTRNPYLYEKEKEQDSQQDVQPSSSGNLRQLDTHQNGPCTNTERLIVEEEVEKVMMIKVRSEEDIIKFELCLSLGVGKLLEEVATRLNLKMGTFKLKYLDEDNDEILVTCDADLQLCLKSQKTMGKTCIELFLRY